MTPPLEPKRKLILATDSSDASGMGAHMLVLGACLCDRFEVTVAVPRGCEGNLTSTAFALGLAVKEFNDITECGLWLQSFDADLLHVHAGIGWEGHGLAHAGKAAGVPVIRTEHLPFLLTDEDQKATFREGLGSVERLIVVSRTAELTFSRESIDPKKISVVRNGIPRLPEGIRVRSQWGGQRANTLISIARFTPQKDHPTLVRAMPTVLEQFPDAVLLLVGTGPEVTAVKDLVVRLGIEQAVLFAGQRNDIASLLASADVFVLASLFEGLPLAVLEAMSIGVPVVATAIGGTTDALGDDHPFLVEPGSPEALAEGIIAVLGDPIAAARTGEAERLRFKQHFTARRMVEETEEIYRAVLHAGVGNEREHPAMERTRIGFIGAGGIATRHLDILAGFDDVELVGFADPDMERARHAAGRFGARAFSSCVQMLDGLEIDAAYICVPPFAHGDVERELIAKRIPFFVEKPVSLHLDLAQELAAAIATAGLITAVGYHWRYLDIVEEARQHLAENPAQLISGYWLDQTPPPRWWWKKDTSGGQTVEQTTHIVDLARYLVGDITRVFGQTTHRRRDDFPDLDVATSSTASLSFATGAIGNIASTCALRWGHHVGLNIFADGLAIELTDHDIMVDVGAGRPVRRAEGDPVWLEDRDFVDAVRGGESRIRCPYHEALATHRIALALTKSAETGQPIDLHNF